MFEDFIYFDRADISSDYKTITSNMTDLLKAHQDLTNRYEELLIMPLNIMKTSGSP
jgi:hypothetical protein